MRNKNNSKRLTDKQLKDKVLSDFSNTQKKTMPKYCGVTALDESEVNAKQVTAAANYFNSNGPHMNKIVVEKNLISNMFPCIFEPKTRNRFVVEIMDENDNLIIPHYLVKEIKNISFYYNWIGQRKMHPLSIRLYDPVFPNIFLAIANKRTNYKIVIRLVGPVGDLLETITVDANLKTLVRSDFKWGVMKEDDALCMDLSFKVKSFLLK